MKKYNPYIASRVRISRSAVEPHNIYAITRYEDRNENLKSKPRDNASLIFVMGIYEDKLNSIKLNDIEPKTFFSWLKKLRKNRPMKLEQIVNLDDVLKNFDNQGKAIFEGYVKGNKQIYNPKTYRTYRMDGLRSISRVVLQPQVYQEFFEATIE